MPTLDCPLDASEGCPPRNHLTQTNPQRVGTMEMHLREILKGQRVKRSRQEIREFAARVADVKVGRSDGRNYCSSETD
jgi:hypothetical protein